LQSTSSGISIATPHGEIQVMDPTAYRIHFGIEPPSVAAGMRLCALRFTAPDLKTIEASLKSIGVGHSHHMNRLVVAPAEAMGAALVFEQLLR
jgi:hypothetical protein